jgi:hypothetical protein
MSKNKLTQDEMDDEGLRVGSAESERFKLIDKHLNSDGKDGNLLHRNTVLDEMGIETHAIGYVIDVGLEATITGKPLPKHLPKNYLMMRERLLISGGNGRGRRDIVEISRPSLVPSEESKPMSWIDRVLGPKRSER